MHGHFFLPLKFVESWIYVHVVHILLRYDSDMVEIIFGIFFLSGVYKINYSRVTANLFLKAIKMKKLYNKFMRITTKD